MAYKMIDMETYKRRDHFAHFAEMENPFVTMCVRVDITDWLKRLKAAQYPFFLCFQYAVIHAANNVPEFRHRIRGDGIAEYDFCNPSYIFGLPDGTYRYCVVNTNQPLDDYIKEARAAEESALHDERLCEKTDDLQSCLFTSTVPWLDFESCNMPYSDRSFSIPSFLWGKYRTEKHLELIGGQVVEREKTTIPLVVFVNHALMDGLHIGTFFEELYKELGKMRFEQEK